VFVERPGYPTCHYFLKVKNSQLCFTEEKDLSIDPSVPFILFPRPTGLGHRSQITQGPVLRPLSYTKMPLILRMCLPWGFTLHVKTSSFLLLFFTVIPDNYPVRVSTQYNNNNNNNNRSKRG